MNATGAIKGWCPGALRPMPSGDGLIVRLRLTCGELSPALALELAEWGESFGNGLFDLSARGNLQMRGVSEATWGPLIERLGSRGLIDETPQAEAVRNVLVSPFAGFFADTPDVRTLARALEAALGREPALWRLPGKFGFSLDAGAYPLGDFRADVAFEAEGDGFWLRLAGAEDRPLGPIAADDVVSAALAVARLFLEAREVEAEPPRRMRDFVGKVGVAALAERLGLAEGELLPARAARPMGDVLGFHDGFVGVGWPLGRLRAGDLARLAEGAALRLTPWRAMLVLGIEPGAARRIRADLDAIFDGDDPRLAVVACPGAPDCTSATVETRELALALAKRGQPLHVSGCVKGCAYPRAAALTVVGRDGLYDVVRNGRADGAPEVAGLDREALVAHMTRRLASAAGAA